MYLMACGSSQDLDQPEQLRGLVRWFALGYNDSSVNASRETSDNAARICTG